MSEEDARSHTDDRPSGGQESTTPTDEPGGASESSEGTADEDLLEHVEEAEPEDLANELDTLQERAESAEEDRRELAAEVEDLEDRVRRIQADFQNYKKRTERRREEQEARATQDLVERLVPVRENLARAVNQDSETDIREGVEATLVELDTVFENEGVTPIEPTPGDDVDPMRHEVVHREDDDADSIASVYRRGYEMSGSVIRPAQVTVGTVADAETDVTDSTDTETD